MDKKNLLAIILSVVVISAGFLIQNKLFPNKVQAGAQVATEAQAAPATEPTPQAEPVQETGGPVSAAPILASTEEIRERTITVETDLYIITFSNRGGVITSLQLKEHQEGDDLVDMVNAGTSGEGAFSLKFGGLDAPDVNETFEYKQTGEYTFEFSRVFLAPARSGEDPVPFLLRKTYQFQPDEYMMELRITIENSVKEYPNLGAGGYSYTLISGPQIGPLFEELDQRREYRRYMILTDGKPKNIKVSKNDNVAVAQRVTWAGIVGKYFTLLGIPDQTTYKIGFSTLPVEGAPEASTLYFSRPPIKSSRNTDVFHFYIGPKTPKDLGRYNDSEDNGFSLAGCGLDEAIDSGKLLGWLENILKWLLLMAYKVIPNYGVAIILLTIFIKLITFPINQKASKSTAKMKALGPAMEEMKKKYGNNPQKLNQEMAALYKREGVNPMGGCLPLLIQFPIFIALYGLLNKHFELRGAVFLAGWISDLSQPESIWNFAPFKIPLLGWSDIRLLPIIYVATQLVSSRFTQTDPGGNQSMKIMMYMMPIVFFFVLYDMPSGLILYWTVTNILSVLQQLYSNRMLARGAEGDKGRGQTKGPTNDRKKR